MRRALLCALLLLLLAGAASAEEAALAYSRMIDVPGVGPVQYYAQNDPLWATMYYEPNPAVSRRRLQESGCGPAAAAMAIARQVAPDDLPALLAFARSADRGFPFCSCSVTGDYCDEVYRAYKYGTSDPTHQAIVPASAEDFSRWLPVILASYATGNNSHHLQLRLAREDGTKIDLFRAVAQDYGLAYAGTRDWAAALDALRAGASVITTVTQGVFTQGSHYLFLAGADDAYLYILDSEARAAYRRDKHGYLTVLEPGLVRVALKDVPHIGLYSFYIIRQETMEETADAHTR